LQQRSQWFPPRQWSQPQPQLQPGKSGQNSSHLTTQTTFFTSFISHTTLQYLSQPQWRPQWAQQLGLPQASVPGTAVVPPAAQAEAASANRMLALNTKVFMLVTPLAGRHPNGVARLVFGLGFE
jgi:hypothetical protein